MKVFRQFEAVRVNDPWENYHRRCKFCGGPLHDDMSPNARYCQQKCGRRFQRGIRVRVIGGTNQTYAD